MLLFLSDLLRQQKEGGHKARPSENLAGDQVLKPYLLITGR